MDMKTQVLRNMILEMEMSIRKGTYSQNIFTKKDDSQNIKIYQLKKRAYSSWTKFSIVKTFGISFI
jgi:hypothetical protein